MTRITLDLDDDLAAWAEEQAKAEGSATVGAWRTDGVRLLNAASDLDAALDEGLASEDCTQTVAEVFADIRRRRSHAA